MSMMERLVAAVGAWLVLAAAVNGAEHDWLSSAVCLFWATACLVSVFGLASDRRARRAQREHRALLAAVERQQSIEARSAEWVRNEEGIYVRLGDDAGAGQGSGDGHHPQRDECGDQDQVR
ncbi:hypothetical protein SEA_FLAPPER_20 [Gordonia phage Flapper]|uniref:Uncharacterized protein n=2 Tax=Gruunavirus TaxID=2948731 RepID=A0A2L1IXC8_9CAUD|nr:hypothetical protein KNT82_gp20 [Gordonia phage Flapper]AVD99841.1 hypothetical protein SEA_FLAPPER_20 [Gordonia phage Flapper]